LLAGLGVFFANRPTALMATTGLVELAMLVLVLWRAPCQHITVVNRYAVCCPQCEQPPASLNVLARPWPCFV
jgi:hypothetical protein